jgi:hypothetical protein
MPAKRPNHAVRSDLTKNYFLSRDLIRVANMLFGLRRDTAIFSGYIYDKPDSTFKIKVYHNGEFIREVTLYHLAYGGLLHVELITQNIESAMRFDLLGFLKEPGFRETPVGISVD